MFITTSKYLPVDPATYWVPLASAIISLESLAVDRAETVDGKSATVTLSAYWRPPVLSILVPKGFRIEVTSVARSVFW
jgi:hypothetical protein